MNNIYAILKRFLSVALISGALPLAAQIESGAIGYYDDAGRFSRITRGGTARSIGLGNATTALGGDMGVTTTNAAGLGFYRRSELNFSPSFGVSGGSSDYLNNKTSDSKGYFAISNMGVVINLPSNSDSYKGGALSFGMNRVNNFQNKISFTGINAKNNFGDYLTQSAQGSHTGDLQTASTSGAIYDLPTLAYASYLINPYSPSPPFPRDTMYHTYYENETVQQKGILTNKGAQYNWYAAYGGNVNDKLYFGVSVTMSTVKRDQSYAFNETVGKVSSGTFTAKPDTLIDMTYYNNLKTTGTGVSFSGGVIWKPSKVIRLGASIISPTFYAMKDTYNEQLVANFVPNATIPLQDNYNYSTVQGVFKYNYRSPLHASGGVAVFLGKKGFLTGDIEVVPYGASKFSAKDKTVNSFAFDADNKTIKNIYKTAFNFRGGAEFRAQSFLLRGGFAYLADPTNGFDGNKRNMMQISGGFGIRGETQYIDFALVNSRSSGYYQPYSLKNGSQPTASIKYNTYSLVISGGVYF